MGFTPELGANADSFDAFMLKKYDLWRGLTGDSSAFAQWRMTNLYKFFAGVEWPAYQELHELLQQKIADQMSYYTENALAVDGAQGGSLQGFYNAFRCQPCAQASGYLF